MKTNVVSKSMEKALNFRQDQALPYENLRQSVRLRDLRGRTQVKPTYLLLATNSILFGQVYRNTGMEQVKLNRLSAGMESGWTVYFLA